jgi:hypothetical protein
MWQIVSLFSAFGQDGGLALNQTNAWISSANYSKIPLTAYNCMAPTAVATETSQNARHGASPQPVGTLIPPPGAGGGISRIPLLVGFPHRLIGSCRKIQHVTQGQTSCSLSGEGRGRRWTCDCPILSAKKVYGASCILPTVQYSTVGPPKNRPLLIRVIHSFQRAKYSTLRFSFNTFDFFLWLNSYEEKDHCKKLLRIYIFSAYGLKMIFRLRLFCDLIMKLSMLF